MGFIEDRYVRLHLEENRPGDKTLSSEQRSSRLLSDTYFKKGPVKFHIAGVLRRSSKCFGDEQ